jgi:large subunit ribosomal protein L13
MFRTYSQSKEAAEQQRSWLVVDANGARVGRLASEVAGLLRGKHKATYSPHVDGGDFVVVINAEKAEFTGRKWDQKVYSSHSGYAGGLKQVNASTVRESHPERVIEHAVKGMLPKGPLGRKMFRKLKVYVGNEHPHLAQQPKEHKLIGNA